jgi:hypothetical protein
MLGEPTTLINRAGTHLDSTTSHGDDFAHALASTPIDPALWDYLMSELQGQGSSSARPDHRCQSGPGNVAEMPVAAVGTVECDSNARSRRAQSRAHSPNADQSVESQWRASD